MLISILGRPCGPGTTQANPFMVCNANGTRLQRSNAPLAAAEQAVNPFQPFFFQPAAPKTRYFL
jgi:hypothetical protein